MARLEKNEYFHVRGIDRALKNRVKAVAAKKGLSMEGELRELIERTYPAKKK